MQAAGMMARPIGSQYPGAVHPVVAQRTHAQAVTQYDQGGQRFLKTPCEAGKQTGFRSRMTCWQHRTLPVAISQLGFCASRTESTP